MSDTIKIDVQRYRPEIDNEPFIQSFDVPYTHQMAS